MTDSFSRSSTVAQINSKNRKLLKVYLYEIYRKYNKVSFEFLIVEKDTFR